MSDRYCETCMYWVLENPTDKLGECRCEKLCDRSKRLEMDITDMLIYQYDEGGIFLTGPKFGCVHHQVWSSNSGQAFFS